jgi:hypothetical protein
LGNSVSGENNFVSGSGNVVLTNLSAEDQQAAKEGIQDMIMARLKQRFAGL